MEDVFQSIFASIEAFIYRCKNDEHYTMKVIEGALPNLVGYALDDVLENRLVSWVGITAEEDVDRAFGIVDRAIAAGEPWNMVYRVLHKEGHPVWVRERGCAVYEGEELVYLQGMIVSAEEEMKLRTDFQQMTARNSQSNADVVDLSKRITASVRQLRLLSVNARIEAARSGVAGAGFAVVADEMKSLADENGKWAQIITEKLSDTGESDTWARPDWS